MALPMVIRYFVTCKIQQWPVRCSINSRVSIATSNPRYFGVSRIHHTLNNYYSGSGDLTDCQVSEHDRQYQGNTGYTSQIFGTND